MDLSIIIVNWNGGDELRECLASIRQHSDPRQVQVIVMDNNSSDGSREAVAREFPEMRVVNTGANLGFGKANNLARQYVNTPFVLFLNPDTVVAPGALASMISFLQGHEAVGAMGCGLREADGTPHELPLQWSPSPWTQFLHLLLGNDRLIARFKRFLPYRDPAESGFVNKLYGGCIMARKSALDAVGWFDDRYFMYAEDIDLSHSLVLKGYQLYHLSSANIYHAGGGTTRKTKKEFPTLMMCESICKLMAKYHGVVGGFLYRLAVLVNSVLRLLLIFLATLVSWCSFRRWKVDLSGSRYKYYLMTLWSLKLRKPTVPGQTG